MTDQEWSDRQLQEMYERQARERKREFMQEMARQDATRQQLAQERQREWDEARCRQVP